MWHSKNDWKYGFKREKKYGLHNLKKYSWRSGAVGRRSKVGCWSTARVTHWRWFNWPWRRVEAPAQPDGDGSTQGLNRCPLNIKRGWNAVKRGWNGVKQGWKIIKRGWSWVKSLLQRGWNEIKKKENCYQHFWQKGVNGVKTQWNGIQRGWNGINGDAWRLLLNQMEMDGRKG